MSFWYEIWSCAGALVDTFSDVANPGRISLKDAVETNFMVPGISDTITTHIQGMYNARIMADSDTRLWLHTSDGLFTTNSAFRHLHMAVAFCPFARFYWVKFIPKKMSVMFWRFLRNAIPVDVRIQDCAINLASGCVCCAHRNIESMDHLFFRSEVATFLWDRFGAIFGIHRLNYSCLKDTIWAWFNIAPRGS
ncbi:Reverse transcriptase zinc-binding domain [Macleaya cordata]|uniref:Reverse transcriptase zinc-binding domain n=1 Tax=Macleaya cordata TaxID=56857 RepID=A0A200QXJ7_MACCD|nr:Reverse transcriptase zinc-binding domain [Macleaya cordata]